ncbi:polynucleotide adenylyltransferase, partial [Chloroflexota bacterium]
TLLHSLADQLATYAPSELDTQWLHLVALVARMLDDYWEGHEERVEPRPLVDGRDIMRVFDLHPGPQIGRLLEAVREAQVSGEVRTAEEALALVRRSLDG